jgi:hypothetical protein
LKVNKVEVLNVNTTETEPLKAAPFEQQDNQVYQIKTLMDQQSKKRDKGIHVTSHTRSLLVDLAAELDTTIPNVIEWLLDNRKIKMNKDFTINTTKNRKADVSEVNQDRLYELKNKYNLSSLEEVVWLLMNDN